uniref:C2H2-type domain-containing protein n=1 Tax=Heligmosomoides polygyrus TaxID=6339 RepID=A0A183FVL5_HELPZ
LYYLKGNSVFYIPLKMDKNQHEYRSINGCCSFPSHSRPYVRSQPRISFQFQACSSCLLVFSDPLLYRMHVGTHVWGRPFQCVACGTVCHDRVAFQHNLNAYLLYTVDSGSGVDSDK